MNDDLAKQILTASLTHIPFDGWTWAALEKGAQDCEIDTSLVKVIFFTIEDALARYAKMIDQEMLGRLENQPMQDLRVPEKIKLALLTRLDILSQHRLVEEKLLQYNLHPLRCPLSLKRIYSTVNEIWYWAGDRSTDFNFYTKRMTLAAVWVSVLIYWVRNPMAEQDELSLFIDKRLKNISFIPKIKETVLSLPEKAWSTGKSVGSFVQGLLGKRMF